MNRKLLKITVVKALVLLTFGFSGQVCLRAQDSADSFQGSSESASARPNQPKDIEGVWDSRVTIRNCQTGDVIAMFRAMDMFHRGGTLTDTNAVPPSTRGTGFGTWEYLGHARYNVLLRFFLYNPDGSFAGVRRIAQDIALNRGGDEWTSTVSITVYDPAGTLTATACATATATRFQ